MAALSKQREVAAVHRAAGAAFLPSVRMPTGNGVIDGLTIS
jgi:hypothetical protein